MKEGVFRLNESCGLYHKIQWHHMAHTPFPHWHHCYTDPPSHQCLPTLALCPTTQIHLGILLNQTKFLYFNNTMIWHQMEFRLVPNQNGKNKMTIQNLVEFNKKRDLRVRVNNQVTNRVQIRKRQIRHLLSNHYIIIQSKDFSSFEIMLLHLW